MKSEVDRTHRLSRGMGESFFALKQQLNENRKRRRGESVVSRAATASHERIVRSKTDTRRVLALNLPMLPKEILGILYEFAKDMCIYWPSMSTDNRGIQVWRWSLGHTLSPQFYPEIVSAATIRQISGEVLMTSLGTDGGFLMIFPKRTSRDRYQMFHFSPFDYHLERIRFTDASLTNPCLGVFNRGAIFTAVKTTTTNDNSYTLFLTGGLGPDWRPSSSAKCCSLTFDRHLKCAPLANDLRWQRLPDMPVALHAHSAAGFANGLIVTGGTYEQQGYFAQNSNLAWFFSIPRRQWVRLPDLPLPSLSLHATAVMDDTVVLLGGCNGSNTPFNHFLQIKFSPQQIERLYASKNIDGNNNPDTTLSWSIQVRSEFPFFNGNRLHWLNASSFVFIDKTQCWEGIYSSLSLKKVP